MGNLLGWPPIHSPQGPHTPSFSHRRPWWPPNPVLVTALILPRPDPQDKEGPLEDWSPSRGTKGPFLPPWRALLSSEAHRTPLFGKKAEGIIKAAMNWLVPSFAISQGMSPRFQTVPHISPPPRPTVFTGLCGLKEGGGGGPRPVGREHRAGAESPPPEWQF